MGLRAFGAIPNEDLQSLMGVHEHNSRYIC